MTTAMQLRHSTCVGVRCDSCLGWYHTQCMGMGTHTYEDLDGTQAVWICHTCGVPNYSDGHIFSTSSIKSSNSFSSLASLHDDGSELLLSPPAATSLLIDKCLFKPKSQNKKPKLDSMRFLVVNFQSVSAKRESMHTCVDQYKPHVIATESWLKPDVSNNEIFPADFTALSELLIEMANQHNLKQTVLEPTRWDRTLDLFFTSNPTLVSDVKVIPGAGVSDHDGILMIDVLTKPQINKPKPRKLYRFDKADVSGLKSDILKLSQDISSREDSSVEKDWCDLRDGISDCMDRNIYPQNSLSSAL